MTVLLINDVDQKHLADVMDEMATLGAPSIHAVYMPQWDAYVALEGCHRIVAASKLGLIPTIIPVEYSDAMLSTVVDVQGDDYAISDICNSAYTYRAVEFGDCDKA